MFIDRNVTLWQDSQETQRYISESYVVTEKDDYIVVDPSATGNISVTLPTPKNGRKIYVVNLSSSATVTVFGMINAVSSVTVSEDVVLFLKALRDRYVTTYGFITVSGGGLTTADIGVTIQPFVDDDYNHTDNNYTDAEKDKLSNIQYGAELNVQSDWNATSGDAFILNKPTHNTIGGAQGGSTNEYYHLTSSEYTGTGTGDFVRETSPTISDQTVDHINFSTGEVGRLTWNDADGTLDLGMGFDGVTQQIGLESYYKVKNQSGTTLLNGYAVRAVGTLGNSGQIKIGYAIGDGSVAPRYNLGILTMDIPNGGDGFVTNFGLVRGINTTGAPFGETWADGDLLYVSPTTPGWLTKVEPTAPHHKILLAIVINSANNGSVFVRPTTMGTLNDIQGVYAETPVDNALLTYNLDNLRWEQRVYTTGTGLSKTDNGSNVEFNQVAFVGDSGSGGMIGAVPAPLAGDGDFERRKYLCADGLWRRLDVSDHNSMEGLQGGVNTGVFEPTAFEMTAFQQGVVQFYHLSEPEYSAISNQSSVLTTNIDVTITSDYYTVIVSSSGVTVTMPEIQVGLLGKTWTIIQDCAGYVDTKANSTDEILLPSGNDTVRMDQLGSTLSLKCVSLTKWVIV